MSFDEEERGIIFHGGTILTLSSRLLNRPVRLTFSISLPYFSLLIDFEIEACGAGRTFRLQINKIAYVVKKIELHRFKLSRKIMVKNFFGKRLRRNRFVLLFNDNTMIINAENPRESGLSLSPLNSERECSMYK